MKYVYFSNSSMVAVTNTETGCVTQFFVGDPNYDLALELVRDGEYEAVENLNIEKVATDFLETWVNDTDNFSVTIENGVGTVRIGDFETPLANALVNKILKMAEDGFDAHPLMNFIELLYQNPSKTAVDELFLFLENSQLPITEDGHFIAYKIVRHDYLDIYTGTMDNSVNTVVSMPRNMVDDKRENTCSKGLHFCSRDYLPNYGSGSRSSDRCLLVKINPADVVSIPSDYDNAKGRTWRYEVVGEVAGDWRGTLPNKDYTDSSVVDSSGNECCDVCTITVDTNSVDAADQFIDGYLDGYMSGKKKEQILFHTESPYWGGYEDGYKAGKNKRKNIYKDYIK